ncbi:MAG: lectin like domain-containing protein, partial [Oscillospiraceae bacterium]|nr:lectin like domain-containing protein [Oscillospiraceae bacterium]
PPAISYTQEPSVRGLYESGVGLEKYDPREGGVTPVKNQQNLGVCWAFASTGALEAYVLKNDPGTYFSENHMRHALSSDGGNPYGFNRSNDGGGNAQMAAAYFMRSVLNGTVLDATDPYVNSSAIRPYADTRDKAKAGKVTGMIYIPDLTDTATAGTVTSYRNQIKQAVSDYGAVTAGYYTPGSTSGSNQTGVSYYTTSTQPNHDVLIVGWDDGYERTSFSPQPPGNGAWLVKNSWGPSWGQSGFFWMSYYTPLRTVAAVTGYDPDFNDEMYTIYEYDEFSMNSRLETSASSIHYANVFDCTEENKRLTQVILYVDNPGKPHTIYTAVGDSGTNKIALLDTALNGPAAVETFVPQYPGYYTRTLNIPNLEVGQTRFAVAVKVEGSGGLSIVLEGKGGYSSQATSDAGQSYYKLAADSWVDSHTQHTANVPIKAIVETSLDDADAVTADKALLTWDRIKGLNVSEAEVKTNLALPTTGRYGSTISWSSSPDIISNTGEVSRPAENGSDAKVTLTATIQKGDVTDTQNFTLTVLPSLSDEASVEADEEWLTWEIIRGSNTAETNVTSNLTLPATGPEGSEITWSSFPATFISNSGVVTRPAYGTNDEQVTLTASVTKGDVTPVPVVFELTVKANTAPPTPPDSSYTVIPGTVGLSGGGANHINLTAETLSLGITAAWYSLDGGKKWRKGPLPADDKWHKLFNKDLTLWVADKYNPKAVKANPKKGVEGIAKGVPDDGTVVQFPKIDKRPKANPEKLKPFYGPETWTLMTGTSPPSLRYEWAATADGKTPTGAWGTLDGISFGILAPGEKTTVLFRTAPSASGETYIPAGKTFRVKPKALAKAPSVKANGKKGELKIKKGFACQTPAGLYEASSPLTLSIVSVITGDNQVSGGATVTIWKLETGKNPPSAPQSLILPAAPAPAAEP